MKELLYLLQVTYKLVKIIMLLSFLGYIISYFQAGELPNPKDINRQLYIQPKQGDTFEKPFTFEYRGHSYRVIPLADYVISGLVVSHNNITAFYDIYHDEDSVDLKDLCLIWGDNVIDDVYNSAKFWSESVSCHYKTRNDESGELFRGDMLSNNHLLSDSEEIRERIRKTRIGDQVRMRGYLIDYHPVEYPEARRPSSMTRDDTGGGACEVMFVTEYEVLKQAPRFWFNIYDNSKKALFWSLVIFSGMFLVLPWFELKYG